MHVIKFNFTFTNLECSVYQMYTENAIYNKFHTILYFIHGVLYILITTARSQSQ